MTAAAKRPARKPSRLAVEVGEGNIRDAIVGYLYAGKLATAGRLLWALDTKQYRAENGITKEHVPTREELGAWLAGPDREAAASPKARAT